MKIECIFMQEIVSASVTKSMQDYEEVFQNDLPYNNGSIYYAEDLILGHVTSPDCILINHIIKYLSIFILALHLTG